MNNTLQIELQIVKDATEIILIFDYFPNTGDFSECAVIHKCDGTTFEYFFPTALTM